MKTVIDVEAVVQWLETGKIDGSPFNPLNELVSVGYKQFDDQGSTDGYVFTSHKEGSTKDAAAIIQAILDKTTLLIGHNIKFDMLWLLESGFKYDGALYCTMGGEYVLARAIKLPMSLKESCIRRKTSLKKGELIDDYWSKKIGYDLMPREVVEEYGSQDVQSCYELYIEQQRLFDLPINIGLKPTLSLHNEFTQFLIEAERNGIYVNSLALNSVERDYIQEKDRLVRDIGKIITAVMGDTPININAPEQLSQVIYSRKVIDKKLWADTFNLGTDDRGKELRRPKLTDAQLKKAINDNTLILRRTDARQCDLCSGTGRVDKFTVAGRMFKIRPKCKSCGGLGISYIPRKQIAGLGLGPRTIKDITANGFSTDKETLEYLASLPRVSEEAKQLLTKLVRLNAVETYLSSFVGGIRRATRANKLLHTTFNQCITGTGRLSSSDPNFQNQPRGLTFPVKRCIRSRFLGGSIMEADGMQLEFRTAAGISQCPVMLKEIWDGVDVHAFTAKTLTNAGQPTSRQDAKSRTFRPLFGGQSGTPAEVAYNKAFMAKYVGLATWHDGLLEEACNHKMITSPSGRQYAFPYASRNFYGWVNGQTQIKNYEVQGFATGDYIPIVCIRLWKLFKKHRVKSLLINTVHDSVVVDVYPGEEQTIIDLMIEAFIHAKGDIKARYGYDFNVPLGVEIKQGHNWLRMKEVAVVDEVKLK